MYVAKLLQSNHDEYIKQPFELYLLQVVMPTVEADVAFGLGKFNLSQGETKARIASALESVGMSEYLQVGCAHLA